MGESFAGIPRSERSPEDRLDSWKEIAAYLDRDMTTVQRWERREGMPVHRHLHDKMGSVYAFRSELEAWTQARNPAVTRGNGDVEAPLPSAGTTRWPTAWALAAGTFALVVVAAL